MTLSDIDHGFEGATSDGSEANLRAHEVLVIDHQNDVQLDPGRYCALVQQVLKTEGVPQGSQTAVTFVASAEMAELNTVHMGYTEPTDVLAFPLDLVPSRWTSDDLTLNRAAVDCTPPHTAMASARPDRRTRPDVVLVGDIVVCPAVAAQNVASDRAASDRAASERAASDSAASDDAASERATHWGHDGSVTAEIDLLVVHGLLHLMGMDHAQPDEAAAMTAREAEHLRRWWSHS